MERKGNPDGALVIGSAALVAIIAAIVAAKPVKAAIPDEKLDYLMETGAATVELLGQVVILLQQLVAAPGIPPAEGVEVAISTPWIAKDPEQVFSRAILSAGTFYSDKMVNWTRGKRLLFKVESSLNQAVNIQLIGNTTDDRNRATDIGVPVPCAANDNTHIGPAWDDWMPYVGVEITVAAPPTAGILNIWAVIQE